MKILGIDTSGLVASVALVEDDVLRAEFTTNDKKTHSQTLLPMLEQIRGMIGLELDSVDAIAIAAGPGSFTGLRIGSATAKGLGLALGKPLVEVPTLEGLAYNLWGTDKLVCPMMDARRNQVYTGLYEYVPLEDTGLGRPGYELRVLTEQCAVEVSEMVEKCNRLGREVIFLGDGVPVYLEQIRKGIRVPYSLAPAHQNRQRAGSVAALGAVYAAQGRRVEASDHQPIYLRKSQAEREREEADGHTGT
ncbi:MAG: tRNA (adenosine(37)-N6)-threonylcarbamoyltransferase complex dimerization subunit type 1 TsaB [Lachnospiraceae bacterium]|nr:tRNA (adenosine(37)-N6)-threonylcarbamoyltransferase complex dimerization subunit type 1 TsaB [Lachnospiraceae bacterium]